MGLKWVFELFLNLAHSERMCLVAFEWLYISQSMYTTFTHYLYTKKRTGKKRLGTFLVPNLGVEISNPLQNEFHCVRDHILGNVP